MAACEQRMPSGYYVIWAVEPPLILWNIIINANNLPMMNVLPEKHSDLHTNIHKRHAQKSTPGITYIGTMIT